MLVVLSYLFTPFVYLISVLFILSQLGMVIEQIVEPNPPRLNCLRAFALLLDEIMT